MKTKTVYATTVNPNIYEGGAVVIELYLKKKDAEIALEIEKSAYYKSEGREQDVFERWAVLEYKLNADASIIALLNGIGDIARKLSNKHNKL